MRKRINTVFPERRWVLLATVISLLMTGTLCWAKDSGIAGLSHDQVLHLGERMYREGILPSGEPMQAVVQGDVPVDGTMFTCSSCHLRSGLGSIEGTVLTPPTNGSKLYIARPKSGRGGKDREHLPRWFHIEDARPAYTDKTLADALLTGIDPAGKRFDPIMPLYLLSERDMSILIAYLKELSSEFSPGVTRDTITFATIVTDGSSPDEQAALVEPIRAYLKDRSTRSQYYKARSKVGAYAEKMDVSSRGLDLNVWELRGDPSTWSDQMDAHYRQNPVFAVLSGTAKGAWEPIHRFCETRKIPCILPVTEFPVVSDSDWYTIYYSKGYYQEAEAVTRYLRGVAELPPDATVVQIFGDDRRGRVLSEALKDAHEKLGRKEPINLMIGSGEATGRSFWESVTGKYPEAVIVLWLDEKAFDGIRELSALRNRPRFLFLSSTLLGDHLYSVPEAARKFTYVTYPHRLPSESQKQKTAIRNWLKVKKIPVTNFEMQSRGYFLGWLLTDVLMMMGTDYYRDYFLDVIDMEQDQTYMVASYPRLSFGQGQRYASKGCYIIQLTPGPRPEIVRKSEWVIH